MNIYVKKKLGVDIIIYYFQKVTKSFKTCEIRKTKDKDNRTNENQVTKKKSIWEFSLV